MGHWDSQRETNIPNIPEFYAGRSLLITGATGFVGKVLIERLLWTCPEISRLILLMRHKKNVTPDARLTTLKQSPVFEMVKRKCPHQLNKLWYIPGDLTLPQLGLTDSALEDIREVSIVFHCAATVKFDEPFRSAVEHNLRSVIRLMDICDSLPGVEAFVYTSTAYSNPEFKFIEEKIYRPSMQAEELLNLVDRSTDEELLKVKAKLIYPKPNTYTFTKAIAESAVERRQHRPYPVAVFRPTIVVSSLRHPFPGWIDSANGPSGVIIGTGRGLLHVLSCRSSALADMLPVDIAVDTLIAIAWETAIDKSKSVRVYNCSTCENPTTWRQFQNDMIKHFKRYPLHSALWYPSINALENRCIMRLSEIMMQTIPLNVADYLSRMFGVRSKYSLTFASMRLHAMNQALSYFALREWRFATDNVTSLRRRLSAHDRRIYNLDPNTINWEEHNKYFIRGVRRYILKEPDNNIHEARRRLDRLFLLHAGARIAAAAVVSLLTLNVYMLLMRRRNRLQTWSSNVWMLVKMMLGRKDAVFSSSSSS